MVRSRSEYYTSMSVSGLPTFVISVKNMNLLSSSIYKHLKTYLIKHTKNGGTDKKPMGNSSQCQTEKRHNIYNFEQH
jgi:hypothetical protein